MRADTQAAIKGAMAVAKDVAEGSLAPWRLSEQAARECRAVFGHVVGPDDPLWELHGDVARQYLAAGGVPVSELAEWLAVAQRRETGAEIGRNGVPSNAAGSESHPCNSPTPKPAEGESAPFTAEDVAMLDLASGMNDYTRQIQAALRAESGVAEL